MLKIVGLFFGALFLFLSSATSAFADWGVDLSGFTISNTPTTIDENGNFTVNVNLSVSGQAGSTYYLRAAFSHPTTPTSYFGYTKNNAGNWYNGTPTPIDYTQFYRVTLDSNASWIGTIEVKPDSASSAYRGTGDYSFKVGRYTAGGSGPTWSDNSTTIAIVKTQNFVLAWGNNLVGLTVDKGTSYFAEDFTKDLGDKVLSITRWDSSRGRYFTHIPGSTTDNNFPIVLGEGYFVKTNGLATRSITGLISTIPSITISTGYSMISFPRALTVITNAEELLQVMQDGAEVRQIMKWYGGRWLPHNLNSADNNFSIIPGEGYFIRNYGSSGTFTLP